MTRRSEGLDRYFARLDAYPPGLSADEEQALARRVEAGGPDGEDAARDLVAANLRLVPWAVGSYARAGYAPLDELVAIGNLLLCRAARTFRVGRQRFSTYAATSIRYGTLRELARGTKPKRATDPVLIAFTDCYGRDEAVDPPATDESPWLDRAEEIERARARVRLLLGTLDERHRRCLTLRFGLSRERDARRWREIGEEFGVTPERARQISDEALALLRRRVRVEGRSA